MCCATHVHRCVWFVLGCVGEVVGCSVRVWLRRRCAVVWGGGRKRQLVGGFSCVDGCPVVQACRHHKNQPERKFLDCGTNPEIRNTKESEITTSQRSCQKKRKSEKQKTNKIKSKTAPVKNQKAQANACTKRQGLAMPFQNVQ